MSKHISAMGKPVDMAAIRTKNEKVRAIGNMSVNARGDAIDSNNNVIENAGQRVNKVYTKTTATSPQKTTQTPTPNTTFSGQEQPIVQPNRVTQPQSITPVASEPVVELFEELSEHELDIDNEDFDLPQVQETKKKK